MAVDFSGGTLASDGGVLLLRQLDAGLGLSRALAQCFADRRDARFVDHSVEQLGASTTSGEVGPQAFGPKPVLSLNHLRSKKSQTSLPVRRLG